MPDALVATGPLTEIVMHHENCQRELRKARSEIKVLKRYKNHTQQMIKKYRRGFRKERSANCILRRLLEDKEQELRIVHRQLDTFQGGLMERIAANRKASLQRYRDQYILAHPEYQQSGCQVDRLMHNLTLTDGPEDNEDLDEGLDEVDH